MVQSIFKSWLLLGSSGLGKFGCVFFTVELNIEFRGKIYFTPLCRKSGEKAKFVVIDMSFFTVKLNVQFRAGKIFPTDHSLHFMTKKRCNVVEFIFLTSLSTGSSGPREFRCAFFPQ